MKPTETFETNEGIFATQPTMAIKGSYFDTLYYKQQLGALGCHKLVDLSAKKSTN
jgi:hypothetical protein